MWFRFFNNDEIWDLVGLNTPIQWIETREAILLFHDAMENVFLGLYTAEMTFKILGLGFLFNDGAYLTDPWNILDFTIVMSAYITVFQQAIETFNNGGVVP